MHSVFGSTNLGISMVYWWIQVGGFWKNALPLGMLHNESGIILHLPIVKNVIS